MRFSFSKTESQSVSIVIFAIPEIFIILLILCPLDSSTLPDHESYWQLGVADASFTTFSPFSSNFRLKTESQNVSFWSFAIPEIFIICLILCSFDPALLPHPETYTQHEVSAASFSTCAHFCFSLSSKYGKVNFSPPVQEILLNFRKYSRLSLYTFIYVDFSR